MSSRVVSFAQIESICLLSGLEIASAKHQNLNWNSTESNQIHLNTFDFNVFIIRPRIFLSKTSKSQLKSELNHIKSIWINLTSMYRFAGFRIVFRSASTVIQLNSSESFESISSHMSTLERDPSAKHQHLSFVRYFKLERTIFFSQKYELIDLYAFICNVF